MLLTKISATFNFSSTAVQNKHVFLTANIANNKPMLSHGNAAIKNSNKSFIFRLLFTDMIIVQKTGEHKQHEFKAVCVNSR